jgi:hypothetical protein
MHARPEKGQLAEAASLRGASGKPSTWFPLGGHVLKALLSSRILLFCNLSFRSLCYIIVILRGDLNLFFQLFMKFQLLTSHLLLFETFQPDRTVFLSDHFEQPFAQLEASMYRKIEFLWFTRAFIYKRSSNLKKTLRVSYEGRAVNRQPGFRSGDTYWRPYFRQDFSCPAPSPVDLCAILL